MTRQALNVIYTRWLSQGGDGLDLLRVSFNASVRNQKTQELACRNTKNKLGRVKHHLVDPEIIKGFSQIIYQSFLLYGFNHNVIHISMNIAPNLFMKTVLHATLISRLCTLESKGHGYIAEGSKGSYERCLLLILVGFRVPADP